jgi:membrane protein YqaA with SNARE-associated domain
MQYGALFVTAFLAATLIPLPSEVPLALLVRSGASAPLAVLIATMGNYLGACTTYALARGVAGRTRSAPAGRAAQALALFRRYGAAALVLSWMPLVGDAIVALAGAAGVRFAVFSIWTVLGKAARYAVVAWLAGRG